jgi:hypothetical protein
MGYNTAVGVVLVITLVAVMGLSYLMAEYVDMKGVKLAGYCYERFFKRKAVS